MPSSTQAKQAILESIPKDVNMIFELGSGWGHLVSPISRRFPKSQIVGFELSLIPWFVSWMVKKILHTTNTQIYRKNFLTCSLHEADCVICFLYPGAMEKLKIKFREELRPGTYILSNSFALSGWEPVHIIEVNDLWKSKIYIYLS